MSRVVVVGRDAPLWLAALALRRALAPAGMSVTAVELPTALSIADVTPTLPAIEALHARIGIDEAGLLRATGGAYSLGTNFAGEGADSFFLPWGSHGAPVGGEPFFPVWTRARAQGLNARLQDFSLTAVAAMNGRLMLPDEETAGFARTDYAYNLPARAYVAALKGLAPRFGVRVLQTRAIAMLHAGRSEDVQAVTLDDGTAVEGDLFVDTSGTEAVLASRRGVMLDGRREKLSALLRLSARVPALAGIPPFQEQRATASGWVRLHPTRGDTRVIGVQALDAADAEQALVEAEAAVGVPLADVVLTAIDAGRREQPWTGNCVAIGAAACGLDPVLGIDLHLAQLGIVHLLSLFPTGDLKAARAEYNRLIGSHLDRLQDAQRAVYAFAPWRGRFWDFVRSRPPGSTLVHKAETFRARGQIAPMEDESFDESFWQALFIGLGVTPGGWPPAVDRLLPEEIKAAFRGMFGFIRDKVLQQPAHDRVLDIGTAV